jgi:glycosyltransferase involved in cell wall biosynthesis
MNYDLSVLVPARNEEFLGNTIRNILENIEGKTEVIAVLDGYEHKHLPKDPRVTIIRLPRSIGQRAATNLAAKLSTAKYVMKVDAHCSFDKGFDVKMLEAFKETGDDVTMVPLMRNLHAFDWVCSDGHRRYQGPAGVCTVCKKETHKEIMWIGKHNPQSFAYRFDKDFHFQYWNEYKKRQTGDLVESMSIQGSCFMLTRKKYWELDICEESYGSWGNQGVEVACKTWLSGGRILINKKTWYAHMFRTQPGFSFPWPVSGTTQVNVRKMSKDIWSNDKWPKAKHKFQWLIDKFSPIPGWEPVIKGIVYYTDNQLDEKIAKKCRDQLMKLESSKLPIVSVSLKPIDFGVNYVLPLERSLLTMTKQILKGLEESTADVIFFCEHDVLYHPSHFDFTPSRKDIYYYNTNSWMFRSQDGHCLFYEHKSLSGICAYRETLLKHYRERIRRIELLLKEANGGQVVKATSGNDVPLKEAIHRLGFEPGTHNRPEKIDDLKAESWKSEHPNVDIKHETNWTKNRWKIEQFRDKSVAKSWKEAEELPYWGKLTI